MPKSENNIDATHGTKIEDFKDHAIFTAKNGEKYWIDKKEFLGEGSFGKVYKAYQIHTKKCRFYNKNHTDKNSTLAVKIMENKNIDDDTGKFSKYYCDSKKHKCGDTTYLFMEYFPSIELFSLTYAASIFAKIKNDHNSILNNGKLNNKEIGNYVSSMDDDMKKAISEFNLPHDINSKKLSLEEKTIEILKTGLLFANLTFQERTKIIVEILHNINLMHHDRGGKGGNSHIHLDLKPENIMIDIKWNGEKGKRIIGAYVIDFDFMKEASIKEEKEEPLKLDTRTGTLIFMPLEIAKTDNPSASTKSDI